MTRLPRRSGCRETAAASRDTEATPFTELLSDLIDRIPGARAAALVDRDGESVDYAGALSPFDVKVAGAHWQIVVGELNRIELFAHPKQLVVRGTKRSFIVRALADAYAVVVILGCRAGFAGSTRAFLVFERGLLAEAGIGRPPPGPAWTPVVVSQDVRSRPQGIAISPGHPLLEVDVLGAVMGLGRGERGFRVRLATGFETTIVHEPGGAWYADEPIGQVTRGATAASR